MESILAQLIVLIGSIWIITYIVKVIGEFIESLLQTFAKGIHAVIVVFILSWFANALGIF
jgi:hypothetical protein